MIWIMLILFTEMSNLLIKKLCCICLRTMKQWSKLTLKEGVLQWDMFPEPTELLLIGCSIELTWTQKSKSSTSTPKNQLADILTKGNFTRDEWNHLLCLFTSSISVLQIVLNWCRKERKKIQVKKESQQNRNRWWRHESQFPLSSWTEQHLWTVRPGKDACSSSYTEWNVGKNWCSQEWKSDELMKVRTERLVNEQPGLFTQHADRLIVDDNDMDSSTVTESDLSLKSRSFLHRLNDRVERCWTNPQKMQHETATSIL